MGVIPEDRPNINTQFVPLKDDKFITLHVSDGKIQAKYYDYWNDVIKFLSPALKHFGYKIYQIGGPEDPIIQGCDGYFLNLTRAQSAYVQEKSTLHLGVDSVCSHISSAFGKKIVVLYSHIYWQQSPLAWSNPDDVIYLEPQHKVHPCFSAQEWPKSVNTIKLEDICKSVFKLLNLPVNFNFETKFVGQHYQHTIFEIIPDFFGESEELKRAELNLRLDLHFDQQCAHLWAQHYRVKFISDKPLDLNLLAANKKNVSQVTFLLEDKDCFSLEYIKSVKKTIPNMVLIGTNDETLSSVREKFFDWTVERLPPPDRSKLEQFKGCKFLTNKSIFSKTQRFPSLSHWKKQKPFDKEDFVDDTEEFAKDLEHFYIYK